MSWVTRLLAALLLAAFPLLGQDKISLENRVSPKPNGPQYGIPYAATTTGFAWLNAGTANCVVAGPASGGAAAPTCRALVLADFPTLNQSTSGTAANVTGIVTTAHGGLGADESAANGFPKFTAGTVSVAGLASGDIPANAANTSGTSSNLSGTPALPNGTTATTQSQADASTKLATTAYVDTGLGTKAPTANPIFTGNLTVPTIGGDTTTSDVASTALGVSGQSAKSTNTVNTAGANLNLAGGLGRRFFTIVSNAALATKTITLTANGTLVTLTASAGAPGANKFGPVGTDDTAPQILVTSTALATAISAHATLGPLMVPSVVAGVVYLTKQPTLNTLVIGAGTAGALVTATAGVDGDVVLSGNSGTIISTATTILTDATRPPWYMFAPTGVLQMGGVNGNNSLGVGVRALAHLTPGGNPGNTAFGFDAVNYTSSGVEITGIGYDALWSNISGNSNTGVGAQVGLFNQLGSFNTMLGAQAGKGTDTPANSNYSYNTFLGYQNGFYVTTGSNNLTAGHHSGVSLTTGSNNVILSGTAANEFPLPVLSTGSNNLSLGYHAGYYANASNEFYLDNQDRTTNAAEKTSSLVYGTFNATPSAQTFHINANVYGFVFAANKFYLDAANNDVIMVRRAAANLQLGNSDAAAPVAQTLSVQNVIATTGDTAGVPWTLAGSLGTGSGAGGAIVLRTAYPGAASTTQNTLSTRDFKPSGWTTLTESAATATATLTFGASRAVAALFFVTIEANDGTDYQSMSYYVQVNSVRKATGNTVTTVAVIGTPPAVASTSATTLTAAFTATEGAAATTINVNAVSSLTQTTLRATFQLISNGPGVTVAQL
jgi:hypothetical protein